MKRDYYLPFYQGGGLVLPQYASGQLSYQVPNSGMATLNAMMQVDQQSFNRGIQMDQLNLQRSAQVGNMINTALNQQLQREQSVRATKQLDLANKQYELNLLKQGAEEQAKALAIGVNEFLPGDQAKIDADLAGINKKIADADPSDLNSFIRYGAEKRRILSTYTGAHANKKEYTDAMALFKDNPNSKLIDNALKGGYADLDAINTYADIEKEIYTNTQKFSETGDRQYLDRIKELAPQMKTLGDFINEDMKAQQDAASQRNQILKNQQLENQSLKLEQETKRESMIIKAEEAARAQFAKEYPDATAEQILEFENKLDGKYRSQSVDQINSLSELNARKVASGEITMEEGIINEQRLKNTDGSSGGGTFFNRSTGQYEYSENKDGSKNYGSFILDKNKNVISGTIGNTTYLVNDLISSAKDKEIVKSGVREIDGKKYAVLEVTIGDTEESIAKAKEFLYNRFGYSGEVEDFIRTKLPKVQERPLSAKKDFWGNKERNSSAWIKNNVLTIPFNKPTAAPTNTNINSGFLNSGGSGSPTVDLSPYK